MQKPREIAARLLLERGRGESFTEERLDRALQEAGLAAVDRRLVQELVLGSVRWLATLDWVIERRTGGRRQHEAILTLLRLGVYQTFFLDRIPPHAVVNETVELGKKLGFASKAAFLNAVMRGLMRDQAAVRRELEELRSTRPWLAASHPEWLWQRWTARYGPEETARLMAWNNAPPSVFARINDLRTGSVALLGRWESEGLTHKEVRRPWLEPGLAFELTSLPPLRSLPSFLEGGFYVQDPSTLLACITLDPQPGETVLDLCAAPGGKATFLAQRMKNQGRIIACDVDGARMDRLGENCRRLGVMCVEPTLDPKAVVAGAPARFDRILVDAPCSNTGVMRRRVDLRWRLSAAEIRRLAAQQLALFRLAAPALKPGGVMVYSTCSLEPEENEEVVRAFIQAEPGMVAERERLVTPTADGVDGAYAARLRKSAAKAGA
jgi:16S rRNA (cytosine967-C5)-methyltransferase